MRFRTFTSLIVLPGELPPSSDEPVVLDQVPVDHSAVVYAPVEPVRCRKTDGYLSFFSPTDLEVTVHLVRNIALSSS